MTSDSLTRRRLLTMGAGLGASVVAGCSGGDGEAAATPTPVDLSGGKQDDQGGMIIGDHFGPNGQIFYENHSPEGHENPAWFHTLVAGLFPYYFRHQRRDWSATAIYVTDYSAVDYELTTENDRTFISSQTAPDSFADAHQVTYVGGSDVLGGMGADLLPFSAAEDAEAFVAEHGGETVSFEDIDPELLQKYRG